MQLIMSLGNADNDSSIDYHMYGLQQGQQKLGSRKRDLGIG